MTWFIKILLKSNHNIIITASCHVIGVNGVIKHFQFRQKMFQQNKHIFMAKKETNMFLNVFRIVIIMKCYFLLVNIQVIKKWIIFKLCLFFLNFVCIISNCINITVATLFVAKHTSWLSVSEIQNRIHIKKILHCCSIEFIHLTFQLLFNLSLFYV